PLEVARRAGWFGAARQFKIQMNQCNGNLRVAQDRWRGVPVREIVQNFAFIVEGTMTAVWQVDQSVVE
ncbi:hypothetical protein A2U01_0102569, partial [Trifolium medium]|nr:hypothetical protein [Trifolium medium]